MGWLARRTSSRERILPLLAMAQPGMILIPGFVASAAMGTRPMSAASG